MKLFDIVQPTKKSGFQLHCGCGSYPHAVVLMLHPFILASVEGDMRWYDTVTPKDFEVVRRATRSEKKNANSRLYQ
jgi:hypothetical protein